MVLNDGRNGYGVNDGGCAVVVVVMVEMVVETAEGV